MPDTSKPRPSRRILGGVAVVIGAIAFDLLNVTNGAVALIAPRETPAPLIDTTYQAVRLIPGRGFDDGVIAGETVRNAAYDRAEDSTIFIRGRYLNAIRADMSARGFAGCTAADCAAIESYNLYLVVLTLQNAGGAVESLTVGVQEYPLSPAPRPMAAFSVESSVLDGIAARARDVTLQRLGTNSVVNVPLYVVIVPTDASGAEMDGVGLQYLLGSGARPTEIAFSNDEGSLVTSEAIPPLTTRISLVLPQIYTDEPA